MSNYYNKQGEEITSEEWCKLFGEWGYKRIGRDVISGITISTVWLGADYNFDESGPPIIFETMLFGGEFDEEMERYCTLDEAVEGHKRWVAKVSNAECVTFSGQEAKLLTSKELEQVINLTNDIVSEPKIHHILQNCSDEQLKTLFGEKQDPDEKITLYGFSIYKKKYVPLGEIWMMDKDYQVIQKFKF